MPKYVTLEWDEYQKLIDSKNANSKLILDAISIPINTNFIMNTMELERRLNPEESLQVFALKVQAAVRDNVARLLST